MPPPIMAIFFLAYTECRSDQRRDRSTQIRREHGTAGPVFTVNNNLRMVETGEPSWSERKVSAQTEKSRPNITTIFERLVRTVQFLYGANCIVSLKDWFEQYNFYMERTVQSMILRTVMQQKQTSKQARLLYNIECIILCFTVRNEWNDDGIIGSND